VELLFVTTIVSALAAITVVKVNANSAQRTLAAQADQLRRDLSQVQALAISAGVPLRLSVNSAGTAYQVSCLKASSSNLCPTATSTPVNPSTGDSYVVTLDRAIISPVSTSVDFDTAGRPCTYPCSAANLLTANPAKTLTVTVSGQSLAVYVRPVSGLAERG
jgi:Tfp pilus assembly protein FimT